MVLPETKGDRKESGFLENMVFSFHEFSPAPFSACFICSGHFWTRSEPFVRHEDNVVIDACGESKSVFSR